MCMYISCVGLCVHGFMNLLLSWFVCVFFLCVFLFFLRCFNILCYASGFYMLLFVVRCLWGARVRARVCVFHWHCSAQLSMFNMEKRYRNKIIIIIIIIIKIRGSNPACIVITVLVGWVLNTNNYLSVFIPFTVAFSGIFILRFVKHVCVCIRHVTTLGKIVRYL